MTRKFFIALILTVYSFSIHAQSFTIELNLTNNDNENFMLFYLEDGKPVMNNSFKKEGTKLVITGKVNHTVLASIGYASPKHMLHTTEGIKIPPYLTFFLGNEKVIITGDAGEIYNAKIKGGKLNNEFTQTRLKLNKLSVESWEATKKAYTLAAQKDSSYLETASDINVRNSADYHKILNTYIDKHPHSESAWIFSFYDMMLDTSFVSLQKRYNQTNEYFKNSVWGKQLQEKMYRLKIKRPGEEPYDLNKKDISGNNISLAAFKGKYVLLDFWGSWCGPCRKANPHLLELYNKYKDKGFEIIGISNENDKDLEIARSKWLKAIKEDKITWIQVLNNEGVEENDLIEKYNITSYPTQILIDKEGKIIKQLGYDDPMELDKLLERYFN